MNFLEYMKTIKDYELLSEYKKMTEKVKMKHITCGHIYYVSPSSFKTKGQRCIKCSQLKKKKKAEAEYISFIEKDGEYKMMENYKGNHTKIKIKHIKCGNEYLVAPSKFKYNNRRCPKCNKGIKMTNKEFLERVKILHGDEFEVIDPYKNTSTKINVVHKKCKQTFSTTPHNFIKNKKPTGCPYCYSSHGEKEVRNILKKLKINFEEQVKFDEMSFISDLKVDFYLPEQNAIIEYSGLQHYKPIEHFGGESGFKKTIARDTIKKKYCVDNNMPFIEIPYNSKNIEEEIINQLGMTNSLIS